MSSCREQVAEALRAVRVTSPTSFEWFGQPAAMLRRAVRSALSPSAARELLVRRLAVELYESFFTQGAPTPRNADAVRTTRSDAAFVAALSDANAGRGGWSDGWRVVDADDDVVVVQRGGPRLRGAPSDVRLAAGGAPAPGAIVLARRPKELRAASPGFYIALGDVAGGHDPQAVEVRVYFHLTHPGAAPLIAAATRLLNDERVAFSVKVVDHPRRFGRCDAAVLYLEQDAFARARAPLRAVVAACAPHLRPATPPFTKRLAPGVGIGEHAPVLGPSFGTGRCRLLAQGIVDAAERRLTRPEDRLDAVARRFARHGIDLDAAHLASPDRDDYVL
ncbi:MAG TPA: T3SS effector HopA1 family protein [Solirubrobacteraceae bacterium]|nr:T3SS effector HopA1 family protein [Solirubrobacteraceae bacterium]